MGEDVNVTDTGTRFSSVLKITCGFHFVYYAVSILFIMRFRDSCALPWWKISPCTEYSGNPYLVCFLQWTQQGMIEIHPLVHRLESFLAAVCARGFQHFAISRWYRYVLSFISGITHPLNNIRDHVQATTSVFHGVMTSSSVDLTFSRNFLSPPNWSLRVWLKEALAVASWRSFPISPTGRDPWKKTNTRNKQKWQIYIYPVRSNLPGKRY